MGRVAAALAPALTALAALAAPAAPAGSGSQAPASSECGGGACPRWAPDGPAADEESALLQAQRASARGQRASGADNETLKCDPRAVNLQGPSGNPQPSPGCSVGGAGGRVSEGAGGTYGGPYKYRDIAVKEPDDLGGSITRQYVVLEPASLECPLPVFLWFHGQGGNAISEAEKFAKDTGLMACAEANGFLMVLPTGLNDHLNKTVTAYGPMVEQGVPSDNGSKDLGTGWNVGTAGDEKTCITKEDKKGNLILARRTSYSCYASCVKLKQCGRCNWSTCHDDVGFVTALLAKLAQEYCLDMSRVYVGGDSNGGMLTHYLSQEMPSTFAAFLPIFGLPLLGYSDGQFGQLVRNSEQLTESAFITFHDRQDNIIPVDGGAATAVGWAWYYTPIDDMAQTWAAIHACNKVPGPLDVTFPAPDDWSCVEYPSCSSKKVVKCLYDGYHGSVVKQGVEGNTAFWFFNQFRRESVAR